MISEKIKDKLALSRAYFMQFGGDQCDTSKSEYGANAWQALATYLRREGVKRHSDDYLTDTPIIAITNEDGYLKDDAFNGLYSMRERIIQKDQKRFQGVIFEPVRQMRFYVIERNFIYDEARGWFYEPDWRDKKPFVVSRKLPIDKNKIDDWSFETTMRERRK